MAWACVLAKNISLKLATLILLLLTITLGLTTVKLALREPLIVERGCISRLVQTGSTERTPAEIEAFITEALTMRFNTNSPQIGGYLSLDEDGVRINDQKELLQRSMTQKIIINGVKINGATVTVDTDRLISVGNIRSALPFLLFAQIATVTRNESNPYGLVLNKVSVIKKDEGDEKRR